MLNSNLASFFYGPTAPRENKELYALWRDVDHAWSRSPFAEIDLHRLAVEIAQRACERWDKPPPPRLMEALVDVTEDLLAWEAIGPVEVDWDTVRTDALAAQRVRRMLKRRRQWLRKPNALVDELGRSLGEALEPLMASAPSGSSEGAAPFDLTLIECSGHAAQAIERLMRAPYDVRCLEFGLFDRVKEVVERNLARASGLAPGADLRTQTKRLVMPTAARSRAPADLANTYLAGTPFERLTTLPVPFSIPTEARFEHAHIVGGTGHGKTQLLQRLIFDDLLAARHTRRAVVVIDSQGDLIGKLRRLEMFSPDVADSLTDRLVVIDPADVEYPASLNLFDIRLDRLAAYRPVDQERVLNGVVELYETFFGDLLGAELTQKQGVIFKYLARLMLKIPGATIHTLMQLMEDAKPYGRYMAELEGSARHFFEREFFDSSFSATKKQILKRLWGVLSTPAFERMFSQPHNKLDLFQALQDGKIILVSTAKDLLKQEGSQLFGRFFIAMITQAALERSFVAN